jgi:hypothetical protein
MLRSTCRNILPIGQTDEEEMIVHHIHTSDGRPPKKSHQQGPHIVRAIEGSSPLELVVPRASTSLLAYVSNRFLPNTWTLDHP